MKAPVIFTAVALLCAAPPALAQTSYNCRAGTTGTVNCEESMESQGRRANEDMIRRMRERREAGEPPSIGSVGILGMIAKKKEDNWRKVVSDAIIAGDCATAKRVALEHNDFETAERAVRLCEN